MWSLGPISSIRSGGDARRGEVRLGEVPRRPSVPIVGPMVPLEVRCRGLEYPEVECRGLRYRGSMCA